MRKIQSASVKSFGEFIVINACARYRMSRPDPALDALIVPKSGTVDEIGSALLAALDGSRILQISEIDDFFARDVVKADYETWVAKVMELTGYQSRAKFFKSMDGCAVEMDDEEIVIVPLHHEKREAWSGIKGSKENGLHVRLKKDEGPNAVGRGLQLAISRCTGSVR